MQALKPDDADKALSKFAQKLRRPSHTPSLFSLVNTELATQLGQLYAAVVAKDTVKARVSLC